MTRMPPFIRWLALAAMADWLVTRTLARAAIFMPKTPPIQVAYQSVVVLGQAASVLAALLAIGGMGWLALYWWKSHRSWLAWGLSGLVVLSLLFLMSAPAGWLLLSYDVLLLSVLTGLVWRGLHSEKRRSLSIAILLPGLAILVGILYQALQVFYAAFHLPGPSPFSTTAFNMGEILVVLTPLGFWWLHFQSRRLFNVSTPYLPKAIGWAATSDYIIGMIPPVAFTILYLLNPAMTGILTIWSTGLTLFLPWPIYALSLWVMTSTLLAARKSSDPIRVSILLLAAGGFAPQLSTQVFFGLIGLGLLVWQRTISAADQSTARVSSEFPGWVVESTPISRS